MMLLAWYLLLYSRSINKRMVHRYNEVNRETPYGSCCWQGWLSIGSQGYLGILAPENLCLFFFLAIRFVGGRFISCVTIYLVLINHEILMAVASGNDCFMHPGVFGSCKGSHKGYICQLLVNTVWRWRM